MFFSYGFAEHTLYTKIWYKAMKDLNVSLKDSLTTVILSSHIYNMSDERFSTIAQKNMHLLQQLKQLFS